MKKQREMFIIVALYQDYTNSVKDKMLKIILDRSMLVKMIDFLKLKKKIAFPF